MTARVSIVVATYRRPRLLERCLEALLRQNFTTDAYEIIIVDDGPEDSSTRALVSSWQERLRAASAYQVSTISTAIPMTGMAVEIASPPLAVDVSSTVGPRLVYLPAYQTKGPAAARNLGWRAAEGDIIAFTDDDTIADQDWLARGAAVIDSGAAAVSGRVIVPLPPEPTDHERNTAGLERSDFVTANCFYLRSALERVGGFDERFQAAWREDADLYFMMLKNKLPVAWCNSAVVVHPARPERWGVSLRDQRKSFYNALLYKKHPEFYRLHLQNRPPLHYYGMLVGVLTALVGVLTGTGWLAAAGGAAWLWLLGRFLHRRLQGASRAPLHVAEMVVTSIAIPFLSIYWRLRGAVKWRVFFL